ncbi:alpha/beta fold hydrolase [Nocardiopsis sp. MG754419]|uniref:alpha/beta fold hydrolase n=1 Tax=Nocardiopsis sp. MG754419 TaxID=2259865 RepID=UPI001BA56EA4|nr:alpha/beta hydrolase [Nocardiopsis sp. MG754419]MBR8742725.1 alpha/beta hydrolase [Nocardiopsis sp. MG754419]
MERTLQKTIPVARDSWIGIDVYGEPDGPALVIVPGVMSDARSWGGVATALERWSTVAVVNRRGRAPSGPLTDDYSLDLEVDDAIAALAEFTNVRVLFGWSYGGLISLHVADRTALPHVIAYEPIVRPFAAHALPELEVAHDARDRDESATIVTTRIAGMDVETMEALRADASVWETLKRLSEPVYPETVALNSAPVPSALAEHAGRVDLIVGGRNAGLAPYGTTFDDVRRLVGDAETHVLVGQGHMAHLEAPRDLAALVDRLGGRTPEEPSAR